MFLLLHRDTHTRFPSIMNSNTHHVLFLFLHRDPQTKFPYVYTSPTKATTLRSTDMVYVLASSFDLP